MQKDKQEKPGQQQGQQEHHLPPEPAGTEKEKLHEEAEHPEQHEEEDAERKGTNETLGVP